ncbi:type VII toxin-antitoxin system HepT family RNase toxin [Roseiflexus sp. RS-1]|uniref:type VII toxin-antitoxin system HepT family RNase toxin n=1 Tax=Roseiflexus sp. (strain RS-1) TaxID=357808 RepID=UPI0000D81070|nr:DUF86 domain-containing protein [Roseiflexus sp. RS-1]ABQ91318.1 protein of unknown function DUF86 [Roseiflexus sp. RS-1]MBO9322414.1 DUF86 domain-containing protein [Roseiflexus sp.]
MIDPDIVLAKVAIIQRCLDRIRSVTHLDPNRLEDIDTQDIFVLNLQRAIQAAIDLGAHTLASQGRDMPATLREIFVALAEQGLLSSAVARAMQNMCGFRNIAVHDYRKLSLDVLKSILVHHLTDLEAYYREILALLPQPPSDQPVE